MIRDIEFMRECLLDIEENAKPLELYPIMEKMVAKGYEQEFAFAQLLLMAENQLFGNYTKDMSFGFSVFGLSNRGYDFLESIRNDEIWKKTKTEIEKKKLPRTIEFIAKIAGVFLGEFVKHKNGD